MHLRIRTTPDSFSGNKAERAIAASARLAYPRHVGHERAAMTDEQTDRPPPILRCLTRTPGQTFVLCPLAVIVFECALHRGRPGFIPWGLPLLAWGYLQYRLVGGYRLPRAGWQVG